MSREDTWKQSYVESRKNMKYYKYLRSLISICSVNVNSILDVGSGEVDLLSHCRHIPEKYSVDLRHPLCQNGVVGIREDFLKYESGRTFDIVCCFQVIEHIVEVEKFCEKLLQSASHMVIVSVPYMWEKGKSKYHVWDPIDVEKLEGWFGFPASFCNIVDGRLIAIFMKNTDKRNTLLEQNGCTFADFYSADLLSAAENEHRVPFEKLQDRRKVVLYGAGERGCKYYNQLRVRSDYEVVLWVDRNYEKFQGNECGIYSPDKLKEQEYDVILIAVKDFEVAKAMKENAIVLGATEEQLVWVV